jgi:uncharacterized repeat protein (TIGR03803 family)
MRRTCVLLVFLVGFSLAASSQVLTTLADFNGSNGSSPSAALVLGTDGNFYGTTATGGDFNVGTVFKITPAGILTTLHSFNGPDGDQPLAPLVQATDGNFYGTTASGGGSDFGTVFKITSNGAFTSLYSFTATDGQTPYGGLVQDSSGDLFGTTSTDPLNHKGTIFKITTQGVLTTLHVFNGQDGSMPHAGLTLAADGTFYGTTQQGGAHNYGTVFKVTSDGALTTLYSFNNTDGAYPVSRLVLASDGNFYGTTAAGGPGQVGTIFRITPGGSLTVLHNFAFDSDGWKPNGLVQSSDGFLYGTTFAAGNDQSCGGFCGTIFQLSLDGKLTTAYRFSGQDDGYSPQAGLTAANDESLYGTALGGADHDGTVFRIVIHANLSVAKSGMGTIISGDGYIYCGNFCSHTYPGGTQVGLTANPAAGYTFSSWDGCDNANGNFCSITMSQGKDVIATFDVANTTLASLTFQSPSVKGGNIAIATVTLNAPAPPGGLGVALSSDQPLIVHPPSLLVVPGGRTSYSFAVRTSFVKMTTVANVTASTGASQVSATLTVTAGYGSSQQNVGSHRSSSR